MRFDRYNENRKAMKIKIYAVIALLLVAALNLAAVSLEQVGKMLEQGQVEAALAAADSIVKAQPKSAAALLMLGDCRMAADDIQEAESAYEKAREKGSIDAYLRLAELYLDRYNLDRAEAMVDQYKAQLAKKKKNRPADMSEPISERMIQMRAMLDRVEDIVVIDSIVVDKNLFFEAFRLSPESGTLNPSQVLPFGSNYADPTVVYRTEDGREMIWGAENPASGKVELYFTDYLNDGTWETPQSLGEHLGMGGNANYPFLMPDGITLYFASDNEESLGGYDIFISRNNGDGFLQPQNVGMPYNSPFDDYMLAIDEMTGAGWWATDRNCLGDKLTIYVFIPSELRKNVGIDNPNLAGRARLASIADTWRQGEDYSSLLSRIREIAPRKSAARKQFEFTLPDGKTVTSMRDFKSPQARDAMQRYLEAKAEFDSTESQLSELRTVYGSGDTSVEREINYLERDLEQARSQMQRSANDVIRAEGFN